MLDSENGDTIQTLYNRFIRPFLPHKISVHNGVAVKDYAKILDFNDTFPDYEGPLISAIRTQVHEGDSVIIVGGGFGVSTVAAVEATSRKGMVKSYEASTDQFRIVVNTVHLNRVNDYVDLNHAIVGSFSDFSLESSGDPGNAEIVDPSALSNPDVLVLDCEGAEIEILRKLSNYPDTIIVEAHGFLDSSEQDVREILTKKGYEIIDRGVEVESKGVYILTATK